MSGINQMTVLGNVGNIETRYTADGKAIVNLSIAVSESWKDKNSGQKQEKTEWIRCVIFGKPAEIIGQYVNKGNKLYLQGKLQTRKWQNKEGQDQYTTEMIVDGFNGKFELLTPKQDNATQTPQNQPQPTSNNGQQGSMQSPQQAIGGMIDDDLIPF